MQEVRRPAGSLSLCFFRHRPEAEVQAASRRGRKSLRRASSPRASRRGRSPFRLREEKITRRRGAAGLSFPSCSESVHNSPETMPGSWPLSFPTFPGCQRASAMEERERDTMSPQTGVPALGDSFSVLPILGLFHFILSVRPFMEVVDKSASIASPQRPELRPRRLGRLLQESFSPELRAPKAGQVSESALSPPTQALSLPSRPLGAILATLKCRGAEVPGDAFFGTRPLLVASSAKIFLCGANRRPHMNRAKLRALRRPS